MLFNSRPLVEVDISARSYGNLRKIFNSRPLVEVDNFLMLITKSYSIFQLTTSRGGRQSQLLQSHNAYFFNSRPLVEVDMIGMTMAQQINFSTHDLSWRSTLIPSIMTFNILFQLTTSRGGRQQNFTINH